MIQEAGVTAFSGVLKFYSMNDLRRYLKELLQAYEREYDKTSNQVGLLLRSQGERGMEVMMSEGWSKVGQIYVNTENPKKGRMEVVFQMVTDMKPRVSETEQVLRSFESIESLPIDENSTFLLYLRAGVPERLIVDSTEPIPEKYTFSGQFDTV